MHHLPDGLIGAAVRLDPGSADGDWVEVSTGSWEERWLKERQDRERAEDEKKYPPPLVQRFDLSDVPPSILDKSPLEWPRKSAAVRDASGVVHGIRGWNDPITECNLWWARSEQRWQRSTEAVDCIECLARCET